MNPPNRKPPVAPPVFRPQQAPKVLQTKAAMARTSGQSAVFKGTIQQSPARVLQMKRCPLCGENGHGKQGCYRTKQNKNNPGSDAQQQSKAQRAYNAFRSYRTAFFTDNGVSLAHVKQYFTEGNKLHGHGSDPSGQSNENQATKDDADAFVGWFRRKYLND